MIYFKKDNQYYIFVHIPKTAGISISEALIKNIDNAEYISTKKEQNLNQFANQTLQNLFILHFMIIYQLGILTRF